MAYAPREIKDRVAVGDDIFLVEDLGNNRIRLIPDPTQVLEPGTPVNKALLQPIEDFLASLGPGGLIPPGAIIMWSGAVNAIPEGWALCDGSNGTPDLRNRFIVGAGGSYNVGDTGGANTVTLNVNQIPSHSHESGSLKADAAGLHRHQHASYEKFATSSDSGTLEQVCVGLKMAVTTEDGEHTHIIRGMTHSAGGGQAHENRPPYYALAYIMKL